MNIYHLVIRDNDDSEYEMNLHYFHTSKNATDLWNDYNTASVNVIDNKDNWTIHDILNELEKLGWVRLEIETVEVEH